MTAASTSPRLPGWYRYLNPVAKLLLAVGNPMGPNVLVTVRGRKTGRPRSTPLMIFEDSGKRWLVAPYGEVNWVLNLRAAGRATITRRRRREDVAAVELGPTEAVEIFRDVLGPYARRMRFGSGSFDDPVEAAKGRPIFELHTLP